MGTTHSLGFMPVALGGVGEQRGKQPGGLVPLLSGESSHAGCGETHPITRHRVLHRLPSAG
ncbi:MAG TPA: hypothetical protein VHT29_00850 [Solirubrobacteraceae bacterium]|jgi:hypothetical protein|nr:hypothetical protein [Solirubrobacteraceae bacterium]